MAQERSHGNARLLSMRGERVGDLSRYPESEDPSASDRQIELLQGLRETGDREVARLELSLDEPHQVVLLEPALIDPDALGVQVNLEVRHGVLLASTATGQRWRFAPSARLAALGTTC